MIPPYYTWYIYAIIATKVIVIKKEAVKVLSESASDANLILGLYQHPKGIFLLMLCESHKIRHWRTNGSNGIMITTLPA